jgi:hypothetical protein
MTGAPKNYPQYPLYIISKGRAESMITSKSLSRMKIHHYIAIEPQDEAPYEEALKKFNLLPYAKLLLLPFSNHGDGPGRARNWCWDHSKDVLDEEWHWVMDDNISDFYRLQKNFRYRVENGALFRSCEDFCDRYENVQMAGLQYRFFVAPNQKYPPYVKNTRIYSCNLIKNSGAHRWRGRYNEDTDLSLRILKDGDCTIQFNHFLQGKCANQTIKGGNTEEFYHVQATDNEEFQETGWNAEGTIKKSQMLVDMHPDVCRIVWRYRRWHHFCDYTPFKKNELKYKKGLPTIPKIDNNYGLVLTNTDKKGNRV